LADKKEAEVFLQPVDYVRFQLDDYPKIIKKMMDLGTVKQNLDSGVYHEVEECLDDIQLIWDNCKLYNVEDSKIYKQAKKLEDWTQRLAVEQFGPTIDYGKNNPSYFTLQTQLADIQAMDEFSN